MMIMLFVSVISHVSSDDLQSFTEYVNGVCGSCLIQCSPRLVGSHSLGETQMQQNPAGDGPEAGHGRR